MIKLPGWRALALLAVTCGLFLAADAVPKTVALNDASARITEQDVRRKVAVPLLRKVAKYSSVWNHYLLYGEVKKNDTADHIFEKESDMFDTALLDTFTRHLVEHLTEAELEEISQRVWNISAAEMKNLFADERQLQSVIDGASKREPIVPAAVIVIRLLVKSREETQAR